MNEYRFLLYDSTDEFSNDIIQELKNNSLLSTFQLIDKITFLTKNPFKNNVIIKECLVRCELPTIIVPNISVPIEKNNIMGWIKTTSLFNVKTNNIKNKPQKITQPSPQDKLGIAKQEIKKISDNYTFIDEKNTDKLFQQTNNNDLILNEKTFKTEIVETQNNMDTKKRILSMLRGKK
jgi:hypothetical protein